MKHVKERIRPSVGKRLLSCLAALAVGWILLLSTEVWAQKVTVRIEQGTLDHAFQQIMKQGKIQLVYNTNEAARIRCTAHTFQKREVKEILNILLANTPLTYSQKENIYTIARKKSAPQATQAKDRKITGTVTDENGEPLIGVSVILQGTTRGSATDLNGRFAIDAPAGVDALEVSYIGYKKTIVKIHNKSTLNIQLVADAQLLDDVVVTGYQTISKERATGAYSIINADELAQKPTSNISTALNGLVPGLSVQSSPVEGTTRFIIRGQGTLQSNQTDIDPLIVVDGFSISTYSSDNDPFATINPNDVESITVLKDAAATSIYGARAANGVIVITTKKGKEGNKLDISTDAYWSISDRADLDHLFDMASAESQFRFVELMHHYDPISLGSRDPYTSTLYRKQYMSAPYRLLYERDSRGSITAEQYNAEKNRLIELGNRGVWKDDLNDYVYRRALKSQYNVALRGTSDRMNYAFSASYNKEDGYQKGNDNQRIMLNMMTSTKLTKDLIFDVALNTTFSTRHNNGISTSSLQEYISPWTRLVDDNGHFVHVPTASTVYTPVLESEYAGKTPADWHYNPVEDRQYMNDVAKTMNYRVQAGLSYKLPFGLNLSAKGQYERRHYTTRTDYEPESYYVRDLYNTYSTANAATGMYTTYFPTGGIYTEGGHDYEAYNLRAQADYNLNLDKHSLTLLAGSEILSATTESLPSLTRYGYNKNTNSVLTQPDYVTYYTTIFGQRSKLPFNNLGSLSTIEDRYFSVYANAAYTYDEKYSLTASFRTDASNFQSKSQRDKFSPFWSVGGGWLLSRENFMTDVSWVDLLKLRASLGIAGVAAGKSGTSSVTTLRTYPGNIIYTNNEAFNTIAARGNESLTWEKSRTLNIGLDMAFFGNKLSGSIDVYNKFSYDVLSEATVPAILQGVTKSTFNNAEVLNRGFELSLSSNLRIVDDLRWQGTLNYAYNHNEVKKFKLTTTFPAFNPGYVEGYPVDLINVLNPVGYTPEGFIILQGKDGSQDIILDYESSHMTEQVDRPNGETIATNNWAYYLGTSTPKSNMSFTNRFTWKGLTLSVMLTGRFGYYTWKQSELFESTDSNAPYYTKKLDEAFVVYDEGYANQNGYSVFPLYNDDNYVDYIGGHGYMYARNASMNFRNIYMKGDHIRLNEVYLGYDLPKQLLARQNVFKRVNVYAQASNLGIIWSANGDTDPDYPAGTMKPMPTFTFGLKVGF